MEPLTIQMTDEQVKRKQEQQKAKAPPPGTSRILSRATREHKKTQNKPQEVLNQQKLPLEGNTTHPKSISTQPNNVVEQLTSKLPTSLVNEVKTESKSNIKNSNPTIEIQWDIDEWQNLAEELNPGNLI